MLTALNLYNFQSHEESHLDFHPGVNIIIGPTDNGKSSLIRGIKFVVRNRPSGDSIRSWWGGTSSVEILTEEGGVVRYKGEMDKYILSIKTKPKLTFKAFGLSVPEEVSKFLNINEINLQFQLDHPFLLDATPGDVAKHFNKVARLHVIDRSTQNVNKWLKNLTSDIKYGEIEIKKVTKELEKYEGLDIIEVKLEALEHLEKKSRTMQNRIDRLSNYVERIEDIHFAIKKKSKILKIEAFVTILLEDREYSIQLERQILKLESKLDRINELKNDIKQKQLILIHEEAINNLILLHKRKQELTYEKNRLSRLLDRVKAIEKAIKEAEIKYASYVKEFNRVFPDICPLCKAPQSNKHKH